MPKYFAIIGDLSHVEIIASGNGVHARRRLTRAYGRVRWRKLKGFAWVRYRDGRTAYVEIHWFEAHGIGKVEEKIVRTLRSES